MAHFVEGERGQTERQCSGIARYLQRVERQVGADVGVRLGGAAPGQQQAQPARAADARGGADDDVAAVAAACAAAAAGPCSTTTQDKLEYLTTGFLLCGRCHLPAASKGER